MPFSAKINTGDRSHLVKDYSPCPTPSPFCSLLGHVKSPGVCRTIHCVPLGSGCVSSGSNIWLLYLGWLRWGPTVVSRTSFRNTALEIVFFFFLKSANTVCDVLPALQTFLIFFGQFRRVSIIVYMCGMFRNCHSH